MQLLPPETAFRNAIYRRHEFIAFRQAGPGEGPGVPCARNIGRICALL